MVNYPLFNCGFYYIRLKTAPIDPGILKKFYNLKYIKCNSFEGQLCWNINDTLFFSEKETNDLIAIPADWIEFIVPLHNKREDKE